MKLPATVWALGLVSLFMNLSSELVHSLLPVYMTTVLGASMHMGLTQGLLATLVADASPAALRGTGFGVFHLVSGIALLAASLLAGAAFTGLALIGLLRIALKGG